MCENRCILCEIDKDRLRTNNDAQISVTARVKLHFCKYDVIRR